MSVYGLLASLAKGNFEGGNSGENKMAISKLVGGWLFAQLKQQKKTVSHYFKKLC